MKFLALILSAFVVFSLGCGKDSNNGNNTGTDVGVDGSDTTETAALYTQPEYFPGLKVPEDNPITAEKIELGRYLFYDKRLSGNEEQACAGCHLQELAFTDAQDRPVGSTGETIPRNSPTITNAGYNSTLTWSHPELLTLEDQIPIPIFGEFPVELGVINNEEMVLDRFRAIPFYDDLFKRSFPDDDDPVSFGNIVNALATFCRVQISANSDYDRFLRFGEEDAISESAKRGAEVFFSEDAECHHCHGGFNFTASVDHEGLVFEQRPFHNTGLYNVGGSGDYPAPNVGLFEHTGILEDMGKFRAPTLRNIDVTGPYMHDGSVETLEEVVRIYERGGRLIDSGPNAGDGALNPFKNGLITGFSITDQERNDLVEFLKSLTDREFLEDPRYSDPFENGDPFN